MRVVLLILLGAALLGFAGCVNLDLGQASKDWSEVGKAYAPNEGGPKGETIPAPAPQHTP
jgi:hypothetical protein